MEKSLARVDLNLLRVLYVLLEERNVTRAAEKLFVTQSAISKSLHRLRGLFDDPLLVRAATGLVLTPRASDIALQLREIIDKVDACIAPQYFDPATAKGKIRIAAPERYAFSLIPRLIMRLREMAPGLSLESQHLVDDHLGMLADGSLDFEILYEQDFPKDTYARHIYTASPMLWCSKEHPLVGKEDFAITDICVYPLIAFRTHDLPQASITAIKQTISATGLPSGKVILDTNHLFIAASVLMQTDALMVASDFISRIPMVHEGLAGLDLCHIPFFSRLRLNLVLAQHKKTFNSPLHQWVSDEIVNIFQMPST